MRLSVPQTAVALHPNRVRSGLIVNCCKHLRTLRAIHVCHSPPWAMHRRGGLGGRPSHLPRFRRFRPRADGAVPLRRIVRRSVRVTLLVVVRADRIPPALVGAGHLPPVGEGPGILPGAGLGAAMGTAVVSCSRRARGDPHPHGVWGRFAACWPATNVPGPWRVHRSKLSSTLVVRVLISPVHSDWLPARVAGSG
jgi:hypothetical protein